MLYWELVEAGNFLLTQKNRGDLHIRGQRCSCFLWGSSCSRQPLVCRYSLMKQDLSSEGRQELGIHNQSFIEDAAS